MKSCKSSIYRMYNELLQQCYQKVYYIYTELCSLACLTSLPTGSRLAIDSQALFYIPIGYYNCYLFLSLKTVIAQAAVIITITVNSINQKTAESNSTIETYYTKNNNHIAS